MICDELPLSERAEIFIISKKYKLNHHGICARVVQGLTLAMRYDKKGFEEALEHEMELLRARYPMD